MSKCVLRAIISHVQRRRDFTVLKDNLNFCTLHFCVFVRRNDFFRIVKKSKIFPQSVILGVRCVRVRDTVQNPIWSACVASARTHVSAGPQLERLSEWQMRRRVGGAVQDGVWCALVADIWLSAPETRGWCGSELRKPAEAQLARVSGWRHWPSYCFRSRAEPMKIGLYRGQLHVS